MSAPGADPLAAIRQKRWLDRDGDDVNTLLALWGTRESALRALVAQWKATAEASEEFGFYARRDKSDAYEDCADALERILSGPQP